MITNLFSNHPSFPNSNSWLTDDWKSEIIIIDPILKFQRLDNPNLAFGINPGDSLNLIINIITILLTIMIGFYLYKSSKSQKSRMKNISLTLILGGALGNLYDRLFSENGAVVDFISIGLTEEIRWNYIFNMADAFITIGMILMLFSDLFIYKKKDNEATDT